MKIRLIALAGLSSQRWHGIAAVALPAIAVVALAWTAVIVLARSNLVDAVVVAQRQNANLALAFEEHSASRLRSMDRALQLAARQFAENPKTDLRSLPRVERNDEDGGLSISIIDAAGQVIAGSSAVEGTDHSARDFFTRQRGHAGAGLVVGIPAVGRSPGQIVIPVSRSITLPDGSFGVVMAGLDPAYFQELYLKMQLGSNGMVQLVGTDGVTRVRRTGSLLTSGERRNDTLTNSQRSAETGGFLSGGRQDGIRRYTSYRTLRDYGLIVAVGTFEDDVLAPYVARRNIHVGAAILFTLLVATFSALALKWTRRRGQMTRALSESHDELVEHKGELEKSNALLQVEVGQRSWEATHDILTGLVNRREFESLVAIAVATAQDAGKHHVVCYMDLDQFKVVNDTCGHAAGDDLLKDLGALLQSRVRQSDTLARLGGDEFGLLLEGCSLERAQLIAADLLAAVGEYRFNRDAKLFTVGVSIGLAAVNADSMSGSEALSMADTACYWAKEQGRNRVCVYRTGDSDMAARRREMGWIARINAALAEGRFTLYHQNYLPLSAAAGERAHLEVLVRMIDDDGGLIQPGSFLPAAERYNLMPAIDRWVVAKVFANYHALVAQRGGGALTCAINLSGTSLNAEGFLEFLRELALEHALPAQSICFEITETAAFNNLRKAAQFIRECKAMGFLFALDDFGTGTSSFGYLKNLPVDYLKIDGGFVKDLEHDAVDKAMTETINRIGHIMGIKTVAEYAENEAIITELRVMGVDYAQGFGISCPTPLLPCVVPADPAARAAELEAA